MLLRIGGAALVVIAASSCDVCPSGGSSSVTVRFLDVPDGGSPRLVLTNTWAWPVESLLVQTMSHVMGSPIGRLLIRQLNLFVNAMIPIGHRLTKPTDDEMNHYRNALGNPARREASSSTRSTTTTSAPETSTSSSRSTTAPGARCR